MTSASAPALRVAMIGYAFMGAAHSQAWRTAGHVAELPLRPELAVVVGRRSEAVAHAADRLGWRESDVDWRRVVQRDDIDLVDICTPGDTHAEIAQAALAAGKHVLCEKPLANTVAQAESMVAAARNAPGLQAMVGFTYRRTPAVALARAMVADGAIGRCLTKVSVSPATPVSRCPVTNSTASMMCAPMSPSAPDPAFSLSSRQVSGACSSASQSCRYWARTCRTRPIAPSATIALASATAGVRR